MSLMALLSKVSKGYGALARKNLVIINVSRYHHKYSPHGGRLGGFSSEDQQSLVVTTDKILNILERDWVPNSIK